MHIDRASVTRSAGRERPWLRRLAPVAVIIVVMAVVFAMGWHRFLSLETLVRHRAAIESFVAARFGLAVATFVAIYVTAVALSIPGASILTITGGVLFGWLVGGFAAIFAATTGATIVFLIARGACGEAILRRAGPLACKLAQGFREDAFHYLLFLRLVPVFPFWLVNIVPALLGMTLGPYTLATLIGIIPGAVVYSSVGSGLGTLLDRGQVPNLGIIFEWRILLPLLGLAVLALVPVLYTHLRARKTSP